jgi:hypothetical protein
MKKMPTPEEILNGLAGIANDYTIVAIIWHLVLLLFIILLFIGKRPQKKYTGIFLTLPFISVGIIALLAGNPFNAVVFLVLSFILLLYALKLPAENIELKLNLSGIFGIIMVAFAWVYPHFFEYESLIKYLYASPIGLIPCPTLILVIGFTLLFQGIGSRRWILVLTLIGLYYGITGLISLKVWIDAGLVLGALVLGSNLFRQLPHPDPMGEK